MQPTPPQCHRRAILACVFAGILTTDLAADTVTLKPSIRWNSPSDVVKLADVAELEGPAALEFAGLPVATLRDRNAVMEISLGEIRAKLDEAGAHWGKINLNGRSVAVRPGRAGTVMPPLAMAPVSIDAADHRTGPSQREDHVAADLISLPTLRGMIANLIVSNLRTDPHHLRLAFDADDAQFLDTPTNAARFEVQPLGSFASDRIDLTVRTWADGKVAEKRNVTIQPRMKVRAAVMLTDVRPEQIIRDADVAEQEQWMPPSQAGLCANRVAAIGRVASRNLKAGDLVRESHIRRNTLIKRGDTVTVRCLVGGAVISLQAEARADGGEGETIEFRKQGERDAFRATVTSRGEAVVDLNRK